MKYLVLIEPAGRNWSGHVPDLPGCVATGKSAKQVGRRLAGAIRMHLDGMAEDGDPPPKPVTHGEYVKV
jgi:predicted RNase H-like HicB family nuclease